MTDTQRHTIHTGTHRHTDTHRETHGHTQRHVHPLPLFPYPLRSPFLPPTSTEHLLLACYAVRKTQQLPPYVQTNGTSLTVCNIQQHPARPIKHRSALRGGGGGSWGTTRILSAQSPLSLPCPVSQRSPEVRTRSRGEGRVDRAVLRCDCTVRHVWSPGWKEDGHGHSKSFCYCKLPINLG